MSHELKSGILRGRKISPSFQKSLEERSKLTREQKLARLDAMRERDQNALRDVFIANAKAGKPLASDK